MKRLVDSALLTGVIYSVLFAVACLVRALWLVAPSLTLHDVLGVVAALVLVIHGTSIAWKFSRLVRLEV